jgi:glycosyltransferase involved in cell wall biosynthesis
MTLSICIATFNRANYLQETLNSILINYLINEFSTLEIVIVDGGSNDITERVVYDYINLGLKISYIKLDVKGGVDKDFDLAVKHSKNKYCWLLPDDDLISEEAISYVYNKLNESNPDVLIANSNCWSVAYSKKLNNKNINIDADLLISNNNFHDLLFDTTKGYTSYIGCFIIKRELWNQANTSLYYGSRFIHIGVLSSLQKNSKILISSKPIIYIRLGNAEWASISFNIWFNLWPSILSLFDFQNKKLKNEICLKSIKSVFSLFLYHRALGTLNYRTYKENIHLSKNMYIKIFGFISLLFPSYIIRKIYFIKYIITNDQVGIFNVTIGRLSKNNRKSIT